MVNYRKRKDENDITPNWCTVKVYFFCLKLHQIGLTLIKPIFITKNQIIARLYTGKNFCECISKMEPVYLQEDLKQEVITIVCGWDEDKIKNLHERGELEFYVVRVILNQIKSDRSPFYKYYRQRFAELPRNIIDESIESERVINEALEDYTMEQIDRLYWYDKEMVKLYLKLGSFRAIEKDTGIPFISCYKNIKKSLAVLKKKSEEVMSKPLPLFTKTEIKSIYGKSSKKEK